ncbi:MAG TPA: hypothetical protein VN716_23350 [Vicinamibacterales bacterium]|nr:hypothetical protein [Vicinamibacterales bacterium]
MNATKMTTAIAMAALLMAAGCGGREGSPSPTAPSVLSDSSQTASGGGGGGCGSAKETLTGAAINGVTPSGEAVADMSMFCSGGSTSLTVNVRNVNLADGVALQVTIDFKPIGTIALSGGSGRLVTSLGHFAVSFDQVRVKNGDATILAGGSFR